MVEALFRLARAWALKGNIEAAVAGYQRIVALDPTYAPAYLALGGLRLRQGSAQDALDHYAQALALQPDDPTTRLRYQYVKAIVEGTRLTLRPADTPHVVLGAPLQDNPHGKLDMRRQIYFKAHRSGWGYGLAALLSLHNRRGVLFDAFLERAFAWRHWTSEVRPAEVLARMKQEGTFEELATSEEQGIIPYTRPWVGVFHNPPAMPTWYHYHDSPQTILAKDVWQRSVPSCIGLFAASEYHAQWLREHTGQPVSSLIFPTEIPAAQFSFQRFRANPHKQVVQIGWWLRKLSAIYQLPIPAANPLGYEKTRLVPHFFYNADHYLRQLIAQEQTLFGLALDPRYADNTRDVQHLPDTEYDSLLAENIAFIELYDASANNAVVECIARATPLLVNPLPAVVEYLGTDYPMYFRSLDEAAAKAMDLSLIHDTHVYLTRCETRPKLSADHFRHSFETSEVYQLI